MKARLIADVLNVASESEEERKQLSEWSIERIRKNDLAHHVVCHCYADGRMIVDATIVKEDTK